MLDMKSLRDEAQQVAQDLSRRGLTVDWTVFQELEQQRKHWQVQLDRWRAEKNECSKKIALAKAKGEDAQDAIQTSLELDQNIQMHRQHFETIQEQLHSWCLALPNRPHPCVPDGVDAQHNVVVRDFGTLPSFNFCPQDHVALGEKYGLDLASAAQLSGARFAVLKGPLARLHRILGEWMLDVHTAEHGYEECWVPLLVKTQALQGTGQLPKFAEDQFFVAGSELALIPTAEVPLTNLVAGALLQGAELPLRWVAKTACFRKEAGSYGQDTKGIIRQHQFEKVELVHITTPTQAPQALETLTQHAERILQLLNLHYRTVLLCAGDLGFASTKTYDLEVWLPSQNTYREVSSCSWMGDFQARRIQARYRTSEDKSPQLLHTLNGSGLAIGRTLVAILEQYQEADGRVRLPEVLERYTGGKRYLDELSSPV